MEENTTSVMQADAKAGGAGCLGEVGWFFSGAVLPMGSLSFYRKAARKSVGSAILFFVFFTLVISTLLTINFGVGMFSVRGQIQEAYANGDIPEVTITDGIAEVDAQQPVILFNQEAASGQRTLVAIDTTGKLREIDIDRFEQGLLLTRTELHVLNRQNGYQVLPLTQLHTMFEQDPILINAETVSQLWGTMSIIIVILAFIFLALWHTVVRLMIISMVALILWGIISLMKPNTGFGPVIITGLYAIVPAIYFSHLFGRSEVWLPGLQTLLLLGFWVIGLIANFMDVKTDDTRPLRLWTALLGLPMLILFVVDMFRELPYPSGVVVLWVVTLFTGLVIAGVRLFFRINDQRSNQPPPGPTSQP
jgi:hypothetical protein